MTRRTDCWTVAEACEQFSRAGVPMEPVRLRMVIRGLRWQSAGETRSGERGGRGQALYEIGQLQRLHAALSPWLRERRE
jgi:hypothetical protein